MAQQLPNFIYTFNYDYHYEDLCKMESRQLFGTEVQDKSLFSNLSIDPNISPFIKNRLDILASSANYAELLQLINNQNINIQGFTVEYLILDGDSAVKKERRSKQKDIGYCIQGIPNFVSPTIIYAVCVLKDVWYFGILTQDDNDWLKHRQKPHSFSNSIGQTIAKTLVSVAAKGYKTVKLLDACCGVGTVMLEACISGFKIEGCDINASAYKNAQRNLAFYDYSANLYHADIKDIDTRYDAAIIDLPYNLYSHSNETVAQHIIEHTSRLTNRMVIVSIADIESFIQAAGLTVADFCNVEKRGRSGFTRKVWVCEIGA